MRRQIRNPGKRFVRGATGPYANKIRGRTYANTFGKLGSSNGGDGNLWKDNPDVVDPGWTDNGDGSYTSAGGDGSSVEQPTQVGELINRQVYTVSFEVSGRTGGSVSVVLFGQAEYGSTAQVSTNGPHSEDVTIAISTGPINDRILVSSVLFVGTISNIVVVPKA